MKSKQGKEAGLIHWPGMKSFKVQETLFSSGKDVGIGGHGAIGKMATFTTCRPI